MAISPLPHPILFPSPVYSHNSAGSSQMSGTAPPCCLLLENMCESDLDQKYYDNAILCQFSQKSTPLCPVSDPKLLCVRFKGQHQSICLELLDLVGVGLGKEVELLHCIKSWLTLPWGRRGGCIQSSLMLSSHAYVFSSHAELHMVQNSQWTEGGEAQSRLSLQVWQHGSVASLVGQICKCYYHSSRQAGYQMKIPVPFCVLPAFLAR